VQIPLHLNRAVTRWIHVRRSLTIQLKKDAIANTRVFFFTKQIHKLNANEVDWSSLEWTKWSKCSRTSKDNFTNSENSGYVKFTVGSVPLFIIYRLNCSENRSVCAPKLFSAACLSNLICRSGPLIYRPGPFRWLNTSWDLHLHFFKIKSSTLDVSLWNKLTNTFIHEKMQK